MKKETPEETEMNVLHYAGISENHASGVSVIVPQIVSAQAEVMQVCLYNYGETSFPVGNGAVALNGAANDDYHTFPEPFKRPDIVVFHSPFGIRKSVRIAAMLQKENIPYVVVPHGSYSAPALAKKRLKKWLAMRLHFRKMFAGAAAIQFLSEGEKLSSAYNEKAIVVPNGVLFPETVCRAERRDGLRISFVGRKDIYHKGLDLLVGACALAKDTLKARGAQVCLCGPYQGDGRALKALISENSVEDIVLVCPPVFGADKEKLFLETDVVALTSRFEGLPGTVLEAWSYGCPTLLTLGSNMAQEAVENGCGWKTENDVHDIAEALINICSNRTKITEKAAAASGYVRAAYHWKKIAERYSVEYEKIIGRTQ